MLYYVVLYRVVLTDIDRVGLLGHSFFSRIGNKFSCLERNETKLPKVATGGCVVHLHAVKVTRELASKTHRE